MAMENGACTVADSVQRDRLPMWRIGEQGLQRLGENARAAGLAATSIDCGRLQCVVLHVVPERSGQRPSEPLEATVPPVAYSAAEPQPIFDDFESTGFPDEVDRVHAVAQPPAIGAPRVAKRRLLADETAMSVHHEARA